ncbi:response regulator [Pontibacter sp. G13]|uniref:response regulator n=1 Tax=Pontibacter sp. G13 TaxID=3074898 RepID=UPI00288AB871|nr:response regulator [Pontibacter sp. G13]WNJ16778.1 response regulator [Pontibacter sp. G13]
MTRSAYGFNRYRLRVRLLIASVLVATVIVLALYLVIAYRFRSQTANQHAHDQLHAVTAVMTAQLSQQLPQDAQRSLNQFEFPPSALDKPTDVASYSIEIVPPETPSFAMGSVNSSDLQLYADPLDRSFSSFEYIHTGNQTYWQIRQPFVFQTTYTPAVLQLKMPARPVQRWVWEGAIWEWLFAVSLTLFLGFLLIGLSGFFLPSERELTYLTTVSVRRRTQRLLDQLFQAKWETAQKDRFVAAVSHEIRNPVGSILGIADNLSQTTQDPATRQMAKIIHASGENLKHLLNDIVDMDKIRAGKFSIEPRAFFLREEMDRALKGLTHQAQFKGLTFTLWIDERIPDQLWADVDRVKQVLTNLVGNAVKFTTKGEIRIRISAEFLEGYPTKLMCTVSDTGAGVPLEDQPLVFKSYEQVSPQHRLVSEGAGLGLAISQQLVDMMGGRIGMVSPGTLMGSGEMPGSDFWFQIPVRLPDPENLAQTASEHNKTQLPRGTRIWIAEDDPVVQLVTRQSLILMGAVVKVASNGQEILDLWEKDRPDLILMDVRMPGLDGIQATQLIRESGDMALPIIGLTANAFQADLQACLAAGMNHVVIKPFEAPGLYQMIMQALSPSHILKT